MGDHLWDLKCVDYETLTRTRIVWWSGMKRSYDDFIKKHIEAPLKKEGFKRIPFHKKRYEIHGWVYFRIKNEIKQDIAIVISGEDETYLSVSTYNAINNGKRYVFVTIEDFTDAVLLIKRHIVEELLPELDRIANNTEIIKRQHELFFSQNYEQILTQFFSKNPLAKKYSLVEQCRFLDDCIENSKRIQFCDALDDLYGMAAYYCYILLQCSNTYLERDEKQSRLVVVRKVPETGLCYKRFPLVHISKMWANRKVTFHTVQFLKYFLTNPEIMKDDEIRGELVKIGEFDPSKGY